MEKTERKRVNRAGLVSKWVWFSKGGSKEGEYCILGYLLRPGEGVVEARNVGHDGLLIWAGRTNDICGGGKHDTEHVNIHRQDKDNERAREREREVLGSQLK